MASKGRSKIKNGGDKRSKALLPYQAFKKVNEADRALTLKRTLNKWGIGTTAFEEIIDNTVKETTKNACNATRRMIVKGFVRKEKEGYGHLGTNNTEITVIEFIRLDDIEYEKVKN